MAKLAYQADYYLNHKGKMTNMENVGIETIPVDINGAFVDIKTDRYCGNEDCLEKVEDNIQERFGLEAPDDDEGGESY